MILALILLLKGSDISLVVERQTITSSSEGWKDIDIGWLPNKKSHHLSDQVESQNNEIKAHDRSLFNTNWRTLKHEWQMFHHISNARLIESLSDMSNKMSLSSLLPRVEQAARKFARIFKNKSGDKNSAFKKRKNAKEEGVGEAHF